MPAELSAMEIEDMVGDWARGCARLQSAGFAGVEISAGHGHLFHQFLSPWSNRRQDDYGGDLAGRTRFLCQLISAIRAECGYPFIIGLKLPADDGVPGGIGLELAKEIAGRLAEQRAEFDSWTWVWGAHARSLYRHLPDAHGERHPYLSDIAALRQAAPDILTGAIGYITDPNECETALSDGTADLVFLGRPLILISFPRKSEQGREADIRYCVSCNTCWRSIIDGSGLECDNNPRVGSADEHDWQPTRVDSPKHIVVVGTGVAALGRPRPAKGTELAWLEITRLGGKTSLGPLRRRESVQRLRLSIPDGDEIRGGVHSGPASGCGGYTALKPDQVILATGSERAASWLDDEWAMSGLIPSAREMAADLLERHDVTRAARACRPGSL